MKDSSKFKVIRVEKARPGGSYVEFGKVFNEDGLVASGFFIEDKLVLACEAPNLASGFMSISGKYTIDKNGHNVGEHNENGKLHG